MSEQGGSTGASHQAGSQRGLGRRTFLTGVTAASAGLHAIPRAAAIDHPADGGASAANGAVPTASEFETFLDDNVPTQLDGHDIAGATVAVVADGDLKVAKGYGYADISAEEPVRADETLFDVASISKSVTGTAVMRAVQAGLVELDTDVNQYLDRFRIPDTYHEGITLDHLGTHTAGFTPQHIGAYSYDDEAVRPLAEAVAQNPPERVRPPGEIASYSNYGFALAGHIVATAADTTFADYVRKQVFDPLGMDHSTFRHPVPSPLAEATTNGYAVENGEFREADERLSWRRPAGGMAATATDMAQFMLLHLQGGRLGGKRFLPTETIEGMHADRFANHPAIDSVGFGFVEHTRGETRFVGMTGDGDVFNSAMALFPAQDMGVFVAYNTRGSGEARTEFIDAFVEEYAPPREPAPLEPDGRPTDATKLVGSYRHTRVAENSVLKVIGAAATLQVRVADDGTLVTQPEVPGPTSRWVQVDPFVFRQIDGHNRLAFRQDDGEITYAFLSATFGLERVPFNERTTVHLGTTVVFLLAFLGGLFGWPVAGQWRRYTGRSGPSGGPRVARVLAGLTGGALVSVIVGGIVVAAGPSAELLIGLPLWFQGLRVLAALGTLGAVAMLGAAAVAWRNDRWGIGARVHYTVLAGASLAFGWVLAYWNLAWLPV